MIKCSQSQQQASSEQPYGLHPFFKRFTATSTPPQPTPTPAVPIKDRKTNFEAMLLCFIAENNLPFTLAPKVINLTKEFAKDPKALGQLSVDRTSASYKMRLGVGRYFPRKT